MNGVYRSILARFRGEIADLDSLALRISHAWEHARIASPEQSMFLDSVALNLHGFYSGIESLFLQVARHLDNEVPQGEDWHAQLLVQMRDESSLRPSLISEQDAEFLDELRRFRHLVRNVYAFNLIPERIQPLVDHVNANWPQLRSELVAFQAYITNLIAEDDNVAGH